MKQASVAIAGCGPGGLAAALFLHRQGHTVTLFERFETPQPIGSGLIVQPSGLAVLAALGLDEELVALAAPLDGLHGISTGSGRLALSMDYAVLGGGVTGLGTHRALLFGLLYDAVRGAGIAIETGREIAETDPGADGTRRLRFADGTLSARFDLVVNAMGTRSPLSRPAPDLGFGALWATLDWVDDARLKPRHLDQRYSAARLMAGIMPIGRSDPDAKPATAYFWSLKGQDHAGWEAAGLEAWRHQALALWPESAPVVAQITDPAQFVFARYRHRTMPSAFETGLAHLGDAWHATSPQLGQGANMALLDAAALAFALRECATMADALACYERSRVRHVRLYQTLSCVFTPAYQSDGLLLPWVRDQAVSRLAGVQAFRRIVARLVAGSAIRPLPEGALAIRSSHAVALPLAAAG